MKIFIEFKCVYFLKFVNKIPCQWDHHFRRCLPTDKKINEWKHFHCQCGHILFKQLEINWYEVQYEMNEKFFSTSFDMIYNLNRNISASFQFHYGLTFALMKNRQPEIWNIFRFFCCSFFDWFISRVWKLHP